MAIVSIDVKAKLENLGVSTLHGPNFSIADDSIFEPPCSIKWMRIHHRIRMSAFSYAVSGFYFNTVIGRYVSIGEEVQIGRGSHPTEWVSTSPMFYQDPRYVLNLTIPKADAVSFSVPPQTLKQTLIGNDVYIGHGALIMQGIIIGDGAVVGAGAVVTKDVPPYAIVAGSPATVKKMRFSDAVIQRMTRTAWWRFAIWDLSGLLPAEPSKFLDAIDKRIEDGMTPYGPKTVQIRDVMS